METNNDMVLLADSFVQSGYFKDIKSQAHAIVKIQAGKELGLQPVEAMRGIHIVEGKPELSASLLGSLIKRSGKYSYRVLVHSETECELEFTEHGVPCGVSKFTMADAQKAGVANKTNWQKYPKNMLFARALSNGARWFTPDVFNGPVYVEGEISGGFVAEFEPAPAPSKPTIVEAISRPAPAPAPVAEPEPLLIAEVTDPMLDRIKAADDLTALAKIAEELKDSGASDDVKLAWADRVKHISNLYAQRLKEADDIYALDALYNSWQEEFKATGYKGPALKIQMAKAYEEMKKCFS